MATLDPVTRSLQALYGWYVDDKFYVNRRYQRKLVWTLLEKQKLVESVLRGYPIPAVILAERTDSTYEIIDGLQRLQALMSFIEQAFQTEKGEFFDVPAFPTANTRLTAAHADIRTTDVLDAKSVSKILDYNLSVSILRGATDQDIDEVFSRINTYGHQLSEQERRQAGVKNEFSDTVRRVAAVVRGDDSSDVLRLEDMPSISIDLPKTRHGYKVEADQVLWVRQGILNAGDLRDSMDEQCLADIISSIALGEVVERSKYVLDSFYDASTQQHRQLIQAMDSYGAENITREVKFCLDEIEKICNADSSTTLRKLIYAKRQTNSFPAQFAVLLLALHQSTVREGKVVADYSVAKRALANVTESLSTSRASISQDERKKNIAKIRGLLLDSLSAGRPVALKSDASTLDIDAAIRRSQVESPRYELKQGCVRLDDAREIDEGIFQRVVQTIAAIANCGPSEEGAVIIGVADKPSAVKRIERLDGVKAVSIGGRSVVGFMREAKLLGKTAEEYVAMWKQEIRSSELSEPAKSDVLSSMTHNNYRGLGVLILRVPAQRQVTFVGERLFFREGDETREATSAPKIAGILQRF